MSTPPRRRRPESRRSKPDGGGTGWLPTIALGLGVIVAGLGIGALVAVFMQRQPAATSVAARRAPALASPPPAVASPPVRRTPAGAATQSTPATPVATAAPTATPAESPTPVPTPTASNAAAAPLPSPTKLLRPQVARSTTPAVTGPATTRPSADALLTPAGRPSSSPAAPVALAGAAAAPTATPNTDIVTSTGTAPPAAPGVTAYDDHASAVVRRYVDALIRGDEKTAYGALGMAGSAPGALSERAFLDGGARIVSLKVTRIDAANASVGCEIAAAKGRYYATYHVTAATSGPYISAHDYIKV